MAQVGTVALAAAAAAIMVQDMGHQAVMSGMDKVVKVVQGGTGGKGANG